MHVVSLNKEASFKYEIIDTYICGIELKGTEVKSIRKGNVNIKDGFAIVLNGEVILKNVYIAPFDKGSYNNTNIINIIINDKTGFTNININNKRKT